MSLWGQLPLDLVVTIIKQTHPESDDAANWCEATEGNSILHNEALFHRWRDVYIGGYDLMAAPGEYEHYEPDTDPQAIECGKLATANRGPQSRINQAIQANHYVRYLYLDIRPRALEPGYKYPDGYRGLVHTSTTAEYSARELLKSLSNLEVLVIDGWVTNDIAKFIPSCRSLTVRPHFSGSSFRDPVTNFNDNDGALPLSWHMRLPTLTSFVLEFRYDEAAQLATFIESLRSLRSLWAKVRYPPTQLLEEFSSKEPRGPMATLLGSDQVVKTQGNLLCRFPASLKSLTLLDHYFLQDDRLTISPPLSEIKLSSASLDELTTQFEHPQSTSNLLFWLPSSRLRRLSLLAGNQGPETDILDSINATITPHESTLEEIVLTNLWYTPFSFGHRFNEAWTSRFAITELTLALKDENAWSYGSPLLQINNSIVSCLYGYSVYSDSPEKRWGDKLERLRLENLRIYDETASADGIEDESLSNLRVLIVDPWDRDLKKHYPQPLESTTEGKLAIDIACRGPSTLRYLSVGLDAFWIDRQPNQDRASPGVSLSDDAGNEFLLRYYADADSENRNGIQSWMSEYDRSFIDSNSRLNVERKERVFLGDEPDYSLVTGRNYMVARRVAS